MDLFDIDIYADGAVVDDMVEAKEQLNVKGFTTNPSLMKKAGITDYMKFAREVMSTVGDLPISFEVFSDDFKTMKMEALKLAELGKNVFVKIPITNTKGESSVPLIKELSEQGVSINVTAILTIDQVKEVVPAFSENTKNIVSVFAGRVADTGVDPTNLMKESVQVVKESKGNTKLLWASCREVLNIKQAADLGVDIITVTTPVLKKLGMVGKDLKKLSLETVQGFNNDVKDLGFSII
ncbi:transaldolase [Pediococcus acidilactici]|uniref:transaldolase n=1 Tax=Pediococcus acidilactici TaxID=1254 RepID=UPI0013281EB1|nr:transaldolase [Pediococcus acidilactici]KAF0362792.1 transaldolase [Pediococcus acidilactici]KAF0366273.1 transaldolase [Pediococcus acidilactici]KAF0417396.1 transaldolase [Pediococcus acidilactici]KAF0420834.1 transaldolase [Pediococcus acidilactici]KAF0473100.1 transaldolase [Pediococcus acidilactici]